MTDDWIEARVDLVSGLGREWRRGPGRLFLLPRETSFAEFSEAIELGFGRWDRAHLFEFQLPDGRRLGVPVDAPPDELDAAEHLVCDLVEEEDELSYVFDFGDRWTHKVTIERTDVCTDFYEDERGLDPDHPVISWGWGTLPDQYGRTTPDS